MASNLLAKTAQGATSLILLQVVSRGSTFIVNQFLLRFLTPQILGVATQLELFSISTLYFARESIRVTIQRQGGRTLQNGKADSVKTSDAEQTQKETSQRVQEAVNLSWLAICLGCVLTFVFEWLYIRRASTAVLETASVHSTIRLYCIATICELLNEPSFAIASQQMLYSVRASSEMLATLARCLVTCGTAFWASRNQQNVGALPFAIGQLTYAIVLYLNYSIRIPAHCKQAGLTTLPRRTGPDETFIPSSLLSTTSNLYGQSVFKQLLTSGDQYLVAALTSLSSQGSYALASNYGGLLARILFQPIEESSRSLFARLLPPEKSRSSDPRVSQATTYLSRVLHAYILLSILAISLGPPLARPLIFLVIGSSWSKTEAPAVLAAYCYYIPMLAINGVLEAFVAAVATTAQLRLQSLWMVAFSFLFATAGAVVLGWLQMGAKGLVIANIVSMLGRITWSWNFIVREIGSRGGSMEIAFVLPSIFSLAVGVASRGILEALDIREGELGSLIKAGFAVLSCLLGILFFERNFIFDCYKMLRPAEPAKSAESRLGPKSQ